MVQLPPKNDATDSGIITEVAGKHTHTNKVQSLQWTNPDPNRSQDDSRQLTVCHLVIITHSVTQLFTHIDQTSSIIRSILLTESGVKRADRGVVVKVGPGRQAGNGQIMVPQVSECRHNCSLFRYTIVNLYSSRLKVMLSCDWLRREHAVPYTLNIPYPLHKPCLSISIITTSSQHALSLSTHFYIYLINLTTGTTWRSCKVSWLCRCWCETRRERI